ncbi:MAG: decarboxylating 6-phosphogluconate dehydrogenase, partial [Actinobacteria bacterium]|nr:decarboxylating 6-phosphogluconate dehydrogenase [Actinomycetota bacterium]
MASQIGFVGLGRMGANMVARIKRDSDHDVVAHDREAATIKRVTGETGARGARSLADLVKKLDAPRMVWIMVPAGKPTQDTVDKLAGLLEKGDMIVDGGNSKWTDDRERAATLKKAGIEYVDVGVSGGVWGLQVGYCMMVGGPGRAVKKLAPILDVLAPETSEASRAALGDRGWGHFGPSGAGHYVKMVHNGVEYGLMQAYAEGWELMMATDVVTDVPAVIASWQQGTVIRSWLLDLMVNALREDDDLSGLRGYAQDSGEGRWTVEAAIDHAVPLPVITAA